MRLIGRRHGNMTHFDIVLSTHASLHPEAEPDDFIAPYKARIRAEGDDGIVHPVGRIHAYRVHLGLAADHGQLLFDVFDAHSRQMGALYAALFDPGTDSFADPVVRQFHMIDSDLLVLDYVVLHPRWRGLRLGLLAARRVVDLLGGGCGLVVSHIAPLRQEAHGRLRVPESWLPRHDTDEAREQAVMKLRGYFSRMGFERIGRSCFYGLSMARLAPTLSELLRPSV
jgi:hypothetical protein